MTIAIPQHVTARHAEPEDPTTVLTHAKAKLAEQRTRTAVLALPFFFALMLPLLYVGIMHEPTPNHMDVAVIGASQASTTATSQLTAATGDQFDVQQVVSADRAQELIKDHSIRGAWDPATGDVFVATAGGSQASSTVTQLFTSMNQGKPVHVHDVVATTSEDPLGSSTLYLATGAIVGGFLTGLLVALVGGSLPTALQIGVATISTAVISGIEVLYGWHVFDLFPGNGVKAGLIIFGISFTSAAFTWGGAKITGPAQVLISVLVLALLGISCSGVSMPLDLAPSFYGWAHQVLPTARGISALKDFIYFPDASITWDLVTMGLWAVGGLVTGLVAKIAHIDRAAGLMDTLAVEEAIAVGAAAAAV